LESNSADRGYSRQVGGSQRIVFFLPFLKSFNSLGFLQLVVPRKGWSIFSWCLVSTDNEAPSSPFSLCFPLLPPVYDSSFELAFPMRWNPVRVHLGRRPCLAHSLFLLIFRLRFLSVFSWTVQAQDKAWAGECFKGTHAVSLVFFSQYHSPRSFFRIRHCPTKPQIGAVPPPSSFPTILNFFFSLFTVKEGPGGQAHTLSLQRFGHSSTCPFRLLPPSSHAPSSSVQRERSLAFLVQSGLPQDERFP